MKPGALEFIFAPGPKAQQLVQRLADKGGWGQITGPHGTGKSTLLATLEPHFRVAGWTPVSFSLHDGQRRMPPQWKTTIRETARTARHLIVIVDGYEQLGWFAASQLQRMCRRKHWGLLVTAHRDMGFPTVYRTASSLKLVETLIDRLVAADCGQFDHDLVRNVFEQHNGNLRDIFFALFDHYERHCRHDE